MYYLSVRTNIHTGGTEESIPQKDFYPLNLLLAGFRYALNLYDPGASVTCEYVKRPYTFPDIPWYPFDRSLTHMHSWYISFYIVVLEPRLLHRLISLVEEIHSSLSFLKDPSTWELDDLRTYIRTIDFEELEDFLHPE